MKITRRTWDGTDPAAIAEDLRGLVPPPPDVGKTVAGIIDEVRRDGDSALAEIAARLGEAVPESLLIAPDAAQAAAGQLDGGLTEALRIAAANIATVAEAQLGEDRDLTLDQAQGVGLREVPVGAAGIYAPGGAAAYPSTVLMGCLPAKIAGVKRVVLATPPGTDGQVPPAVLVAAMIAGVDEIYAVGGAQAIAALALGTETIAPVDVIAGPGNSYVQEAKRRLFGRVGLDGIAGPSELMVIAGETAKADWIALDLCAQAEHADDSLLVAAALESSILDQIEERVGSIAAERDSVADAPLALIEIPDTDAGVALANALAPEHLEIAADDAEMLSAGVTSAGCIFVGETAATAFGDYVAGSNHVLPTGGAGRFQGPLGPGVFRRPIATVEIPERAAAALAGPGATLARAEGFPVHGESMEARANKPTPSDTTPPNTA